jgi:hypothetical protein
MDIHVLILYVYGYTNVQMYNFLVGHTGLYRASYNLIITIMPFVMKRYGTISAILVFEFRGGGVYRSTGLSVNHRGDLWRESPEPHSFSSLYSPQLG